MSDLKIQVSSWGGIALDTREVRNLMRSAAGDLRTKTARVLNNSSGGGRTYRGGGGSRYRGAYRAGTYRASAPGEPPVRVTGTLRNSLKAYVYPSGEGFAVRERVFYALMLEAGAKGAGTRVLAPRPSLDLVMAQQAANLERRVTMAMQQGLKWKQTK